MLPAPDVGRREHHVGRAEAPSGQAEGSRSASVMLRGGLRLDGVSPERLERMHVSWILVAWPEDRYELRGATRIVTRARPLVVGVGRRGRTHPEHSGQGYRCYPSRNLHGGVSFEGMKPVA